MTLWETSYTLLREGEQPLSPSSVVQGGPCLPPPATTYYSQFVVTFHVFFSHLHFPECYFGPIS